MPNRILKESIKTSPQIDALSWFEEVVFYRLIVSADDYGCMDGRLILLRNDLFPTKDSVTKKAIEDAIAKLVSVGLLCRYTVSGMPYLCFPSWERHQRIRNMHRKYPEPPSDVISQAIDRQLTADCQSESESNKNQNPNPIEGETRAPARETEPEKSGKKKVFKPPTLAEIQKYCADRQSPVDPKKFWEYYDAGGWVDAKGQPVRNWKQKLLTWERSEVSSPAKGRNAPPAGNWPETPPAGEMDRMAEMLRKMGG